MKKIIILLTFLALFTFHLEARIITVCNNNSVPAQYTSLQEALDNASIGDTIHVHASHISYGNIVIRKRIVLLGEGFRTILQSIQFSSVDGQQSNNASGSVIKGFYVNKHPDYDWSLCQEPTDATNIYNVLIQRCYFQYYVRFNNSSLATRNHSNWLFKDCIFNNSIYLGGYSYSYGMFEHSGNIIFMNCIIGSSVNYSNSYHIFSHNIFRHATQTFYSVSNITLENNIFFNNSGNGCSQCVFNNNLSTSTQALPYGTNTGSNNIVSTNPQFVNAPGNNFIWSDDYHLQETSPAKGAGIGGVDIGIFGGANPFPNDYTGYPNLPWIESWDIFNRFVGYNGFLKFQMKAQQKK